MIEKNDFHTIDENTNSNVRKISDSVFDNSEMLKKNRVGEIPLQLAVPLELPDITVAVVDDDEAVRLYLSDLLEKKGINVKCFETPDELMSLVNRRARAVGGTGQPPFDLLFSDVKLPQLNGIDLAQKVYRAFPEVPIVFITAYAELSQAVQAVREGAYDYIEKPFTKERIETVLRNALNVRHLNEETRKRRQKAIRNLKYDGIICESPSMQAVYELISRVAKSDSSVLVTGESGVGKEIIAKAIHENSSRVSKPFVSVNCSAIPESLLESELFGHSKGSFTGAHRERIGLFQEADGGSIFLDEIGDLNLSLQAKLLRVLQEKKIRPVGHNEYRSIDVRIVSATHKNLSQEIRSDRFREDLYYRLNVIPVHIAPLRQRKEDIPILADEFLKKFALKNDKKLRGFTKEAMRKLTCMKFNGNVRELQNVIERSVVLSQGNWIEVFDIPVPDTMDSDDILHEYANDTPTLRDVETRYIQSILDKYNGKKLEAAKVLGMSRRTLYRKLEEMNQSQSDLHDSDEESIDSSSINKRLDHSQPEL